MTDNRTYQPSRDRAPELRAGDQRFPRCELQIEPIGAELQVSPAAGVSWNVLTIRWGTPDQTLWLTLDKASAHALYRELRNRFTGDDRYGG